MKKHLKKTKSNKFKRLTTSDDVIDLDDKPVVKTKSAKFKRLKASGDVVDLDNKQHEKELGVKKLFP